MAGLDSFHEKLKGWLRRTLSCCRDDEEEEWKPVIGKPFDFRREDVCIAGLSSAEQEGLRIRAVTDANRMFATLQPLHNTSSPLSGSSPSSSNPAPPPPPPPPRPAQPSTLVSAEAAAATPTSPTPRLDRVKAHTRALSNSLETAIASVTAPTGYSSLPTTAQSPLLNASESAAFLSKDCGGAGNPYEMRQLLSQGSTGGGGTGDGKGRLGLSGGGGGEGEAFERRVDDGAEVTWAGCEEDGDGDSGKGMMGGGYVRTR